MTKYYILFAIILFWGPEQLFGQGNYFPSSGNVGVGTVSPTYPFHVRNSTPSARARFHFGEGVVDLVTYAPGDLAYSNSSGMFVTNLDGLVMVGNAKDLRFVTFHSQYQERMRIRYNGNVGIGTAIPLHKLDVNGTIRAKEVILEASNWPDYVFEESYNLMPLQEVKVHIDQYGHLPGIKSARHYQERGVNVMELNQKLLEKIEELTLYSIIQENNLNSYEKTLKSQSSDLSQLKSNMEDLLVEMDNLRQLILAR